MLSDRIDAWIFVLAFKNNDLLLGYAEFTCASNELAMEYGSRNLCSIHILD